MSKYNCSRLFLILSLGAAAVDTSLAATEVIVRNFGIAEKGQQPEAPVLRDEEGNLYGTTYSGGQAGLGVVYKISVTGHLTALHSFTGGADGANPSSGVIADLSGNLYGTTYSGGTASAGVVYKLDSSGQETVLYSFAGGLDGANPSGGVIRDGQGNLYGTTYYGGTGLLGVVYKLDTTGEETVLYSFVGMPDGANPSNGVVRDADGNLYGTTEGGGTAGTNAGTVFELDAAGKETVLYSFLGVDSPSGASPASGVILDKEGNLYGTTVSGGTGAGVVYKVGANGRQTVLYSFTGGDDGGTPESGLTADGKGNLYGTTVYGGADGFGVVYKLNSGGKETVLNSFNNIGDGANPASGVILDSQGNLYGTTSLGGMSGGGVVYQINTAGQEDVLYNFEPATGGAKPNSPLALDGSGYLYGTTYNGGSANAGVIYKLDTTGRETVLYNFTGGTDGRYPLGNIILDRAGNIYGTTYNGGTSGMGVVFKLDSSGQESVLHNFTGGTDGANPNCLTVDPAGNFYGTTFGGGMTDQGVVYKLEPSGQQSILHTFLFSPDNGGGGPNCVTIDSSGNLYGTTFGGSEELTVSYGGVFKLTSSGSYTELYVFKGGVDGSKPTSGVILDSQGNLYGTTGGGGTSGAGTVFKINTTGEESVLYSFGQSPIGYDPNGIVSDSAGNLYGTTYLGGGMGGAGAAYKLNSMGQETLLHSFTGTPDGKNPDGVMTFGSDGSLFGTTDSGGTAGGGVVFQLKLE